MITRCIFIGLLLLSVDAYGQFLGGFFSQKGTQRKYMLEQIILYQTYLGYVKKGYEVTQKGWNTAKDISQGELNLHNSFYEGLKNVNPAISKQPQVKEITEHCAHMQLLLQQTEQRSSGNYYTDGDRGVVRSICKHWREQITDHLDRLELLVTPGRLQLTDDERIAGINKLLATVRKDHTAVKQLYQDVYALGAYRDKELKDVKQMKELYQLQK